MTTVDQLFELWIVSPDERSDPVSAFRALYTDPVTINGSPMPVAGLVDRARAVHAAFSGNTMEVVRQVTTEDTLTIAFRHTARHSGPWQTPLGVIAATGRTVTGLGIDILTLDPDGRIREIWVLADELQRILQVR